MGCRRAFHHPTDGHACLGAEEVTRDFAYGEADPLIRKCMLLPWAPADMLDLSSSTPEPPAKYYQVWPCACSLGPSVWWVLECSLSHLPSVKCQLNSRPQTSYSRMEEAYCVPAPVATQCGCLSWSRSQVVWFGKKSVGLDVAVCTTLSLSLFSWCSLIGTRRH